MEIIPGKIYAVITGDIIGSTKLVPKLRRNLYDIMKECSSNLRSVYPNIVPYDIDIFSGDSWQMIVSDPSRSLRVAIYYRAKLRAEMGSHDFDTRMYIGIGSIQFIPSDRVSSGDGDAFQLSGRNLEKLKKDRLGIAYPTHPHERELKIIVGLIDSIVKGWTDRQALAITGALRNLTQTEIAKLWNPAITQQSASEFLDLAAWHAIEQGILYFEDQIK